ncbi:MAG: 3-deoxy-manno-octulosonate cytidylyltransferase [Chromatiales bacterium]|jgi:3-deoxy-manno-octulosonate cytidylyltransferase (CMP-KDO synthetase)|nr:3-deoxy-manno-octulosonate cytidylyltransferase [Chromatiales bacterium]
MGVPAFNVVIPARHASTRFPGKPLADLGGRPMLAHVHAGALASGAATVVVATDDERIAAVARGFGADVAMTSAHHASGTERVAEVAATRGWRDDAIVVNLQGDAPLMPPGNLAQLAVLLEADPALGMATLQTPLAGPEEYLSPHVVKVVCDAAGRALYFSRAPIPAAGHGNEVSAAWQSGFRHLGLYAYRVAALRRIAAAPACRLEQQEKLEQLRALWLGIGIGVATAGQLPGPEVDTPEDLERARAWLARERRA